MWRKKRKEGSERGSLTDQAGDKKNGRGEVIFVNRKKSADP